jgi:hypothetical protein
MHDFQAAQIWLSSFTHQDGTLYLRGIVGLDDPRLRIAPDH